MPNLRNHLWIVLPVHNRLSTTQKFVVSLKRQSGVDYTLVLVDDGSTDGTSEYVRQAVPDAVIIKGDGNLWWAGGLDQGYRYLKTHAQPHDSVLLINDDVVFDEDFLKNGMTLLATRPQSLLLAECHDQNGGALLDRGRRMDWARGYIDGTFPPVAEGESPQVFSTRGLFLRVGDWFKIGAFHPWLLPHYGSDYEFTIRAWRKGFTLWTDTSLQVFVDCSTSGIREPPKSLGAFLHASLVNKRYVMNVVYRFTFIVLACDRRYLLRNLWKLLSRFFKGVASHLLASKGVR